MKILVIDDKNKELERAVTAVEKHGHIAIPVHAVGENLNSLIEDKIDEADCVITDLMFNPTGNNINSNAYDKNPPPAGLLVVIFALAKGKPAVICTNAQEVGGHHAEAISWIFDSTRCFFKSSIEAIPIKLKHGMPLLPIGWEENKNWEAAIQAVTTITTA